MPLDFFNLNNCLELSQIAKNVHKSVADYGQTTFRSLYIAFEIFKNSKISSENELSLEFILNFEKLF